LIFVFGFCNKGTNQETNSAKEVGSLSQAPPQPQRTSGTTRARGNIPHPLGLTHPDYIARHNCLDERIVVAIGYYDEGLLAQLGMLDDIGCLQEVTWDTF